MANFTSKVSVFYDYKGRGFSETLWSSLPIDTLQQTQVKAYLEKRLQLADDDCVAVYARISDGANPRRVLFLDLAALGMAGKLSGNGCAPDDCIDVRFVGASNTAAHLFMHAFPAKFVKEKNLTDLGDWSAKFSAWAAYMTTAANGWRLRYSTGNVLANRVTMVSVTADTNARGYIFTTTNSSGLARGDVIAAGGFSAKTVGYRGRKIVTDVAGDGKTVHVGGATPIGDVPANTAYFTKLAFPQEAIKDAYPFSLTERKTGRPFGLPVGRRPNVLPLRR